jgi:hypothetical protein
VEAKPMGLLYFRGDTHPNWLGSYFLYKSIITEMGFAFIPLNEFLPSVACYEGDLLDNMSENERHDFLARVTHSSFGLDITIQLALINPKANFIGDDGYTDFSRETRVYTNTDTTLQKAVIFLDSTSQFMAPWLAEHFSRCVCIWHRGDVVQKVIERENPDIIFQIMAERFVWSYAKRGALNIPLV